MLETSLGLLQQGNTELNQDAIEACSWATPILGAAEHLLIHRVALRRVLDGYQPCLS